MGMNLKTIIRPVPNFPKEGILFYDISTILQNPAAWRYTIDAMAEIIAPHKPTKLAAIESRGFLLAAPLAYKLGVGFVMIRKKNKLPGSTISFTYDLEYGTDTLEIQRDAVTAGDVVVVVDDLLATGGTLSATIKLLHQCQATVPLATSIVELTFLEGRKRLDTKFESLVGYEE
jgi:adenine phosphoribosyltransferase